MAKKNANHKKTVQKAASVLMSATVLGSMAFPVISTLPVFATENDINVVSSENDTKDSKKSKDKKKDAKKENVEVETEKSEDSSTEISTESDSESDGLASLLAEDTKTVALDSQTEDCPFVVSVLQNGVKGDVAVKPGDEITYDVTIRNASDKTIDSMVMYMALPDGMDYVDSKLTQDNSEGQHDSYDATVSWGKGERLLTIRPGRPVGTGTTPTMKAGETLSFSLTGKVTATAGTEMSTNLRVHYHGDDGEVLRVESESVKTTVAEAKKFIVNFDANEGKSVEAITAEEGQSITELPTPTREGYQFDGWYTAKDGGDRITQIDSINADMTLYAHWTATTYTVDFDSQGGDKVDSITANIGETVTELPTPQRKGYTFDGWYDAAEGGNQVTELTSDTKTVYAHWTEKKVEKLELNNHELTVKSGDNLDLKYTYSPDDAVNAEFVWSSSDENIIAVSVKDGKTVFTYKGTGTVKLTVSTKDGSVSDTCTVTVEAKDAGKDDSKKDDSNGGSTVDDNGNGTDNGGNTTTDDGNGSSDTTTDSGSDSSDSDTDEVKQLTLNIIMTDGSTKTATVKDSVKLDDLVQKLGFTSVTAYKYRTASNNSETSMDGSTTMKAIAEMAESEEVLIIGYDNSGNAVGCAKVAKSDTNTYTVTLSKDTNVALNKNDESEKGKGEGEQVSQTGKGDSEAPAVHTADNNVLPVYGAAGGVTTALLGVMAFLRKKILH